MVCSSWIIFIFSTWSCYLTWDDLSACMCYVPSLARQMLVYKSLSSCSPHFKQKGAEGTLKDIRILAKFLAFVKAIKSTTMIRILSGAERNTYGKPHGNRVLRRSHCSLGSNINTMHSTHGERRNMYKILVTEPEGTRWYGGTWRRWKDNIDVAVKQLGLMLNVLAQTSYCWSEIWCKIGMNIIYWDVSCLYLSNHPELTQRKHNMQIF
jgi:hypothetical protein